MSWKFRMRARTDRKESSGQCQGIECTRTVIVRLTRRRGGTDGRQSMSDSDLRQRKPKMPQAQRDRTKRAVTRWSETEIARCASRHKSSDRRRRHSSLFFRRIRRRSIGSLPAARRANRGRGAIPRSLLTRSASPTTGQVTVASALTEGLFLTLLSSGRTRHSSGRGSRSSRQRSNQCRSTRSDCSSTGRRRAQLDPHSGCRNRRARSPQHRSLGRGSRQA